ncbi:MAG: hypothetical protein HYZ84_07640 [Candidatus Omnitrophica bacterium]|nr:hypothetical protein [Candidatus Omnitrophota bacterium]
MKKGLLKSLKMILDGKRGFILITSYLFISILSIFSLALFSRGVVFLDNSERYKNRVAAFHMAESGLDQAMAQLATNPNYEGTTGFVTLNSTNTQAGYTVVVCPPACTGLTQPASADMRLIRSVGEAPGSSSALRGYQSKTLMSYVQLNNSVSFDYAVFASNGIQMSGNAVTDSFDSRAAPYNPSSPGTNGDIGTNNAGAHTVMMSGNVQVKGDAFVGPNGNPDNVIVMSGNSAITGTKSALPSAIDYASKTSSAASEGALSLSGNSTYLLPEGIHRVSSLSITGNAQIQALGPVEIYVDGTVKIAGNGFATQDNLPPNLRIYVTGTGSVSFSGNANFHGALYAPKSQVSNTGNGDIHGAVIAKDYHQSGNGKVHFDEALKNGGASASGVTLKSWQETSY